MKKILLIISTLLLSSHVYAATSTSALNSTATLASSCQLSIANVNFGEYVAIGNYATNSDGTATNLDGSTVVNKSVGTITLTCSKNVAYSIYGMSHLSDGTYHMTALNNTSNTDYISYDIWGNNDYKTNWVNYNGQALRTGTGSGAEQILNFYIGIYVGQHVLPGNYIGVNTMTINF